MAGCKIAKFQSKVKVNQKKFYKNFTKHKIQGNLLTLQTETWNLCSFRLQGFQRLSLIHI